MTDSKAVRELRKHVDGLHVAMCPDEDHTCGLEKHSPLTCDTRNEGVYHRNLNDIIRKCAAVCQSRCDHTFSVECPACIAAAETLSVLEDDDDSQTNET